MSGKISDKRRYLRHPLHLPIALELPKTATPSLSESEDISQGGLSFFWKDALAKGRALTITIPVKNKLFKLNACVAYSQKDVHTGYYRTGAAFRDPDSAFQAKLAEETLEILEYRKRISKSLGHDVPEEEAARDWIKKYAAGFNPR